MSQIDEFHSNCMYYGDKCRKRLFRTKLSRDLALDHLTQALDTGEITRYESLLCQALDDGERGAPQLQNKLIKVVVESHFLTLKVNFEYFLNRMVYCLWWSQFDLLAEQTAKRLLKTSVTLHEIAHALPRQGGMEFVIGQVIPSHGLDLLAKCFEGTTGRSLPDALNKQAPALWSQIHSAFEVRHLIEHRKGKIDQRFIDEVASHPLWDNSSWTDFPLSVRAKIEVRAKDFDATCDAMIRAAEIVTALTRECWLG